MATDPDRSELGLGTLQRIPLREVWANEASDFTPWLAKAENVKLLGEAIGMELEVEGQEQAVGDFSADIHCRDSLDDSAVLIENQLERTDHRHLGQLITYAAGLDAVSIVWIAERLRDEHRAALDWLNEKTEEDIKFFGLEVELWRIGQSQVAPKFNIVCRPNDWSRSVRNEAARVRTDALTEGKRRQLEYWTAFRDHVLESESALRPRKPRPNLAMHFALGRSGFRLAAVASRWDTLAETFSTHELRVQLVIGTKDARGFFDALMRDRDRIESDFGESLTWYKADGVERCRIYTRHTADLDDQTAWPKQHEWLRTNLESMDRVFRPLIGALESNLIEE